jgi:hypothetical protein
MQHRLDGIKLIASGAISIASDNLSALVYQTAATRPVQMPAVWAFRDYNSAVFHFTLRWGRLAPAPDSLVGRVGIAPIDNDFGGAGFISR